MNMEKRKQTERRTAALLMALAVLSWIVASRWYIQRQDGARYGTSRTPYTITGTEVKI